MRAHIKDHWLAWLMIAVILGVATWVVAGSEAFQHCISQAYYESADHEPKKGFSFFLSWVGWQKACTGLFLKENGEAITAFFTLVLAISTIGLWLATRALWRAGDAELEHLKEASERQSSDMQASIQAAKDANLLTRDIFIAGHRPWLQWAFPPQCILTRNGPHLTCTIDATLNNLGNAPAFNIYYFGWLYLNRPSDGGVINIGRRYFDQNLNDARSFGISGLAATILPKEFVPARFGSRGPEMESLPDDFTLYLAFHARYTFAVSGSQWPQAEAEIGTVYWVQPTGRTTAVFNKAEVMEKDTVVALVELPMGRRIT